MFTFAVDVSLVVTAECGSHRESNMPRDSSARIHTHTTYYNTWVGEAHARQLGITMAHLYISSRRGSAVFTNIADRNSGFG